MTWQAWIGAVLFYGAVVVLLVCTAIFAWDGWRNRECGDESRGWRCCLIRKHKGPHRAAGTHGAQWTRTGER